MSERIFISYRRLGGDFAAQLLYDRLCERGFSVFLDIPKLGPGRYDEILLQKIEQCEFFLSILTPGCLTRCEEEDDWVRREIRHAMKHGKKIIPVITRGFEWPDELPGDIQNLPYMNAVSFVDLHAQSASMEQLIAFLRDGVPEERTFIQKRQSGPSMISFVNAFGSNNPENCWIQESPYSDQISLDQYGVVYFHARLRTPTIHAQKMPIGLRIRRQDGALVFENSMDADFLPGHDRFGIGWIIKGVDGSFVTPGRYIAELWIDTSRVYEYAIWITDHNNPVPDKSPGSAVRPENMLLKKRIQTLKSRLTRPLGLLYYILMMAGYFLMWLGSEEKEVTFGIFGILLFFLFAALLIQYTKHHVWGNWIGAVALTLVGSWFYGFYLLAGAVKCLFRKHAWHQELDQLRQYAREQMAIDPDEDT